MSDDIRKELDALDGQTIVLPNDVHIEVIECNGDAFKVYQEQIELANRVISPAITGHLILGQTMTDPNAIALYADEQDREKLIVWLSCAEPKDIDSALFLLGLEGTDIDQLSISLLRTVYSMLQDESE